MSSTNYAADNSEQRRCLGDGAWCRSGHWSVANIAAMVFGFAIFAPLGFAVLIWTLLGRPVQDLPGWVRDKWVSFRRTTPSTNNDSENVVFNEYQQTQYDRIHEIKEEIRRRANAFQEFRSGAKRRKDQQEFEDFMATKP